MPTNPIAAALALMTAWFMGSGQRRRPRRSTWVPLLEGAFRSS